MSVNWNEAAARLAAHVGAERGLMDRGALLIGSAGEPTMAAMLFGNDGYAASKETQLAVEILRQRLQNDGTEELGFALSPDGHSWALLVRAHRSVCQTAVGKSFQMELWKLSLDDAVRNAWARARGLCQPDESAAHHELA
jgi:hypothetical protein